MTILNHHPIIELEVKRCYDCGTYWAIEKSRELCSECPRCAGGKIFDANNRSDAAQRSISSLRGALSRLKNKQQEK